MLDVDLSLSAAIPPFLIKEELDALSLLLLSSCGTVWVPVLLYEMGPPLLVLLPLALDYK